MRKKLKKGTARDEDRRENFFSGPREPSARGKAERFSNGLFCFLFFSRARSPSDPALTNALLHGNGKLTCERSPDGSSDDGGDALELGVAGIVVVGVVELEDLGFAAACHCELTVRRRRRRSSSRFSSPSAAPALFLGVQGRELVLVLPRGTRESGEGLSSGSGVVVLQRRSRSRMSLLLRRRVEVSLPFDALRERPPGVPGVEQARAAAPAAAADERRAPRAAAAGARGARAWGGRAERFHAFQLRFFFCGGRGGEREEKKTTTKTLLASLSLSFFFTSEFKSKPFPPFFYDSATMAGAPGESSVFIE